ncbi:hypothetical protein CD33_14265 [Ureibacillus sinduriensis BLB-1 = JCM 15800]|uniref:Uncharacterized protein n=1 Tax=Ureibacillus sinduriensis BLB-1 = JCM 15800 TaxID=1384057 RepID=A0A0A3HUM6_9BACL|nr:hypothetical protein CD33_14265 [Ureibacillus sinduriensis BLB-1 = JCM 15800]
MYLFFKVLIFSAIAIGYYRITENSEISIFVDFVILFILIYLVSRILGKIEKLIKEKRTKAL